MYLVCWLGQGFDSPHLQFNYLEGKLMNTEEKLPLGEIITIMLVQEFPDLENRRDKIRAICKDVINESMKVHFHGFSLTTTQLCLRAIIAHVNLAIALKENRDDIDEYKKHASYLLSNAVQSIQIEDSMRPASGTSN